MINAALLKKSHAGSLYLRFDKWKFILEKRLSECLFFAKSTLCFVLAIITVRDCQSEVVGGVDWKYRSENGQAILTSVIVTNSDERFLSESCIIGVTKSVDMIIPNKLGNMNVSGIGELAVEWRGQSDVQTIVVPATVKSINQVSFVGLYFTHNILPNGYEYPCRVGLENILFLGDKPKTINREGANSRFTRLGSHDGNYVYGSQFSMLTCWYVYGSAGWNEGEHFYGGQSYYGSLVTDGVMKCGAAKVRMSDMEDNKVRLSCDDGSVKVIYTTDGSVPSYGSETTCEYLEDIKVDRRMVIKACAYSPTYPFMIVEAKEFALGQVDGLSVRPDCESFDKSNLLISINCSTTDALIRYTIDGAPVSENSSVYTGPFMISESTTVRAKAFKTDWFPSEEVVQTFTRVWYTNETPVISAESATFDTTSQEVAISCATEGATVYYTIDGSEPSAANGRVYKGPFNIYDSVTVKAIAVKDDWKDSAVASASFTKNNGLSAAINMYDYLPDNDANVPWTVDAEVSHDGVSSARSGAIGENGVTTMKVTVRGAGRLSFWWKSECEEWDEGYYDYVAFFVGSETEPRLRIAGMTDWKREEIVFDGTGKHVCKWEYHKDDAEKIPRDCIWVDQVQWLPYGESEHDHTLTTEVPVPYLWLDSYGLGRETDFEAAAKMKLGKVDGAGRAMSVEDDYVAGTDPTNLASKLTATIKMGADGKPIVSWKPPLNGEDADGMGIREGVRSYSVYGKQTLDDATEEWTPVTEGDEGNYRFFKVGVGMPEKK